MGSQQCILCPQNSGDPNFFPRPAHFLHVGTELEPFDVPLPDLEKDAKPVTTLNEQCKRFVNHYRYYCRTSNIATYNEEIRIICERYRTYCSDRVYPSVNHIRRQLAYWKHSGLPLGAQKSVAKCYSHCKETDPVCVNACECLHLQWVMDYECFPGVRAPAGPNCQRWAQKCRAVWRPLPDYTPADYGEYAPQPLVRGQFYGYDALGTLIQILSRIRGCAARPVQAVGWRSGLK
ncbi:hypothetical protein Y032_0142g2314 [Ancylostoma ceylanicum]|uniref:Uncharacterized protein n=1 Tax=Ancylostoma ceylanicum TaxID=53326 RepID=A0A016T3H1_9BILA|nr:hypothetical protein Y032_0142g2314 [Ancylostoma ceylanicum]